MLLGEYRENLGLGGASVLSEAHRELKTESSQFVRLGEPFFKILRTRVKLLQLEDF